MKALRGNALGPLVLGAFEGVKATRAGHLTGDASEARTVIGT
jgi:hypothetical protein